MFIEAAMIDEAGRICLPQRALDALGVHAEAEVLVELTDAGVVIKPKLDSPSITERIGQMNLPVADWDDMEREVEAGTGSPSSPQRHFPTRTYDMGKPEVDINDREQLYRAMDGR